jgi:hypothetical protein
MGSRARRVLWAVVATALASPGLARAQGPDVLPAPRPVLPAAAPLPPSPPPPPVPPLEQWLDPGRDGWGPYGPPSPAPGFFFSTELDLVHPVVRNRITNDTPLRPSGDVLTVPTASLPWTVSPWFDLGYRLPDSLGLISLNYRFVVDQGSGADVLLGLPADLHSRLTQNVVNIDYGTTPYAFAPHSDFSWRIGVELADVYFDSTLRNGASVLAVGNSFQQASNNFFGAGPHARMDVEHHLCAVPGLSLFGRVEGAVDFGRISQKFREQVPRGDFEVTGSWEQNGQQTVPTLLLQAGLDYVPPALPHTKFTLGYIYEHWWYIGQLGEDSITTGAISASRGDIDTMGVFLRGQVDF